MPRRRADIRREFHCALVHAKPSTFDAGGQLSSRMQSLPLYEAKPATLVEQRKSARMSLFIVIDLRDGILIPEAPGPRRAVGGAARRANASEKRCASAIALIRRGGLTCDSVAPRAAPLRLARQPSSDV